MLLVRHAWAGDASEWEGDDSLRPLDARGRRQAEALVEAFAPYGAVRVLSSPYDRCVQTVEPLARARGLDVELREELGDERQAADAPGLLRELAGEDVIVCTHGGLPWRALGVEEEPAYKKGGAVVLDAHLRVVEELDPPA
ncbi:MAG: histidine phosphatase family protein [Actinobacteria bacterium]|nr:histidine phosphatase family protein [Actinomycetota bacterium]